MPTQRRTIAARIVPRALPLPLLACAVLAGCSQQYNGAWRFFDEDEPSSAKMAAATDGQRPVTTPSASADPEAARQPQPQRAGELPYQQPGSSAGNVMLVREESTPLRPESHAAAPISPGREAVRFIGQPAAGSAGRSMLPLALYGQVPAVGPASASPMDGPDNLRQVTFATEGADFDPDVSPDGSRIVFASTRHRQTSDIYLQKVDGTTVTQITNDPANDAMPRLSPDGRRVAFCSDRAGNWDIYVIDLGDGRGAPQAVQITSDATQDVHPSWSPDGKRLVYCTFGAQSGQWEMVVVDVDNPAAKRFIGYGLFPYWSPVQDRIVFQRARERGTRWFSVWTIDLVHGEGVRPTEIAASANAAAITPRWSPDGKSIVFCTVVNPDQAENARPRQADVWVISADGTQRQNLTQSRLLNVQPIWAADGSIYFVSNRAKDGVENIWALRPDRAGTVAENNKTASDSSAMVPTP